MRAFAKGCQQSSGNPERFLENAERAFLLPLLAKDVAYVVEADGEISLVCALSVQ